MMQGTIFSCFASISGCHQHLLAITVVVVLLYSVLLWEWTGAVIVQAQQMIDQTMNQTLARLQQRNKTDSKSHSDISMDITNLASVAMQTASLDCALFKCGPGTCVIVDSEPACDCTGTNTTGSHCQRNVTIVSGGSGSSSNSSVGAGGGNSHNSTTNGTSVQPEPEEDQVKQMCPSTDSTECSSHGTCVVPCTERRRAECKPYCKCVQACGIALGLDGVCLNGVIIHDVVQVRRRLGQPNLWLTRRCGQGARQHSPSCPVDNH